MAGQAVELELSVPSSLESIELWQYQKYMGVVDANKDAQGAEEFLNMKLVEIFCGVSLKDVSAIDLSDFTRITEILRKAFSSKTPLIRHFELDGIEFGFVPNLDKITIGEYIDIEANIGNWKTMHRAMGVLYRPITEKRDDKYLVEKYEGKTEYAEVLKYMPLNVALGASVFFYHLGKDLSNHILKSLEKEMSTTQTTLHQQDLEGSGVGINRFIDSLEEKQQKLIRQLESLSTQQ